MNVLMYTVLIVVIFTTVDYAIVKWNDKRKRRAEIKASFANRKPTIIY
jgi:Flp pilus assembly protein TadB